MTAVKTETVVGRIMKATKAPAEKFDILLDKPLAYLLKLETVVNAL